MAEPLNFPRPVSNIDDEAFWDGCRNDELRMQRCAACKKYRWLPRPMCPHCNALEHEWVTVSGRGKVFSWTVIVHPVHPAANEKVPYNVAQVQLDEDPDLILVTNLVEIDNDAIRIDLPVEAVFVEYEPGVKIPQFRPA